MILFFILLFGLGAAAAESPADLNLCKTNTDCVLVPGPCGSPVAIHRKYAPAPKDTPPKFIPIIMCVQDFVPGIWPPMHTPDVLRTPVVLQ